jgi:hypothetical protein
MKRLKIVRRDAEAGVLGPMAIIGFHEGQRDSATADSRSAALPPNDFEPEMNRVEAQSCIQVWARGG